jgi:hypothetical protein
MGSSNVLLCFPVPEDWRALAGFEVLTSVFMKISDFWEVTGRSLLNVNRYFGRPYRVHLQGRRKIQARNQHEAESEQGNIG